MLRPLLTTCVVVLGVTLAVVAIGAGLSSLYMGYLDLTRRANGVARVIEADLASLSPEAALRHLDVEQDVLGALIFDPDGHVLAARGNRQHVSQPSAAPRIGAPLVSWTLSEVTAIKALATPGKVEPRTLVLVYDTAPARFRARIQATVFIAGACLGLFLIATALKLVFRRQMRPMHDLTAATISLSEDHFDQQIPGLERADEIGALAHAVDSFKTKLLDRERLRQGVEKVNAVVVERHRQIDGRVDAFRSAISETLSEVSGLSDQMTVAAESLASISAQASAQSHDAFNAIRETAAGVTNVASASGELTAAIREIERQVDQTRGSVIEATRSAAETSGVIRGLYAKAEEIDEIIGLIQTIAAQTNLLSLNATIEAARAGESGRGFAVVAQEVKSLADQTTKASQHVADHIHAIQDAASRAVASIETIDVTMAKADRFSSIIAVAVERQAAATSEISRSAADAAQAAAAAAGGMKTLASAVGETDQSAAQVHQSATDVRLQAEDVRAQIDRFLRDTAALRGGAAA